MINFDGRVRKKDYKKIKKWLKKNGISHWKQVTKLKRYRLYSVFFKEKKSAFLFKLKWFGYFDKQKGEE